ncbi:MAG TPA: alpha amylase C-terminal domain-containing protein, partial [Planctomycetaceae bacterium]
VDGMRVDGTFHMRTASKKEVGEGGPLPEGWSLLQEITDDVRERFPRAIMTAEDMRGDPAMTRPTAEGGAGFHTQWSDKFAHAVRLPARTPDEVAKIVDAIHTALLIRYNGDPFQRVIFAESHDNAGKDGRLPALADPDDPESLDARRWAALAAAVVFTAPGVPQLFQGQEILDPRDFRLKEPHPLDLRRTERFAGFLRFHKELIALRKNAGGTTAGLTGPHIEIIRADTTTGVLAWRRWKDGGPGDDVLVVANFSREPRIGDAIGVPSAGRWRVRLDSESPRFGDGLGAVECPDPTATADPYDGQPFRIRVSLGPWGVVVLSQDRAG